MKTKSKKAPLTTDDLAARWKGRVEKHTLENWRYLGKGPDWKKFGGRVLYPLDEVVKYERAAGFA